MKNVKSGKHMKMKNYQTRAKNHEQTLKNHEQVLKIIKRRKNIKDRETMFKNGHA